MANQAISDKLRLHSRGEFYFGRWKHYSASDSPAGSDGLHRSEKTDKIIKKPDWNRMIKQVSFLINGRGSIKSRTPLVKLPYKNSDVPEPKCSRNSVHESLPRNLDRTSVFFLHSKLDSGLEKIHFYNRASHSRLEAGFFMKTFHWKRFQATRTSSRSSAFQMVPGLMVSRYSVSSTRWSSVKNLHTPKKMLLVSWFESRLEILETTLSTFT